MLKKSIKKYLDNLLPEYNPNGCMCKIIAKIYNRIDKEIGVSVCDCICYLEEKYNKKV